MIKRCLTLLVLLSAAAALHAHDGPPYPILMDEKVGQYKVSVWTDPDVGTGTFFIYVDAVDGESTEDLKVTVSVAPKSGRLAEVTYPAERQVIRGRVQYFGEVQFDAQEYWIVRITVNGPEGGGELKAEVEATPPGPGLWGLLIYLSPFVLLAGLWVYGILRHRPRHQPQTQGEQRGGPNQIG